MRGSARRWRRRLAVVGSTLVIAAAAGLLPIGSAQKASAAGGPPVVWAARTGPVTVATTALETIAALSLPAGDWWITAKGMLEGVGGSAGQHLGVTCRLVVGGHDDAIGAAPSAAGADGSRVPFLLSVAGHLSAPGKARLRCVGEGPAGDVVVRDVRMTAIRAGRLTVQEVGAGTVTTGSGAPRVIAQLSDHVLNVTGDGLFHDVAALALPAGNWWIVGKAVLSGAATSSYQCRLAAGGDLDLVRTGVSGSGGPWDALPVATQVVHRLESAGTVTLSCQGFFGFTATWVGLVAIRAGSLSDRPLDGGPALDVGSGLPRVISGYSDGPRPIPVSGSYQAIRSLSLPAGRWSVTATMWTEADIPSEAIVRRTWCRLVLGSVSDEARLRYGNNVTAVAPMMLHLTRVTSVATPARLQCRRSDPGGTVGARSIRITAIRVGS